MTGYRDADTRDLPGPLGWCAHCIRSGDWTRAKTMFSGTALCAKCLIEVEDWHHEALAHAFERNGDEVAARASLLDALRGGMGKPRQSARF